MSENKKVFTPIAANLAAERAAVKLAISQQVSVAGFPLPILKGKLNAVVAPSHSGKTIYSVGLAISLARAGHKIMYLSTEEDYEAFIDKTMGIDENEPFWNDISFVYHSEFDQASLAAFMNAVSEQGFEYLVIDYLKKSMWTHYSNDHVVMEEINSTLLRTNAALKNKLGIFTFVQGNRDAFDDKKTDLSMLAADSGKVALMIDGGMPVYRSADNILFIKKSGQERILFVAKSRRNNLCLGCSYNYDVDLKTFEIRMGTSPNVFGEPNVAAKKGNKGPRSKIGGSI